MLRTAFYEGTRVTRRMYGTGHLRHDEQVPRQRARCTAPPMRLMYPDIEAGLLHDGARRRIRPSRATPSITCPAPRSASAAITRSGGAGSSSSIRGGWRRRAAGEHLFIRPGYGRLFPGRLRQRADPWQATSTGRASISHMKGFDDARRTRCRDWTPGAAGRRHGRTRPRRSESSSGPTPKRAPEAPAREAAGPRSTWQPASIRDAAARPASGYSRRSTRSAATWIGPGGTLLGSGLIDMGEAMKRARH